jgi:transcriptional regulator of arginine metabolism
MPERSEKSRRHHAIREVVHTSAVASQDDLVAALAARGIVVTQSTLSRDLRELRITRVPTDDGYRYVDPAATIEGPPPLAPADRERLHSLAPLEVVAIDSNEHLVLVRTLTGRAQGVGVFLDRLGLDDVLGTIAGDDTILVLPRSIKRTAALRRTLERLFDLV